MWDTAEAMLERKFMALNVYMRKEKMLKTNDLNLHSKKLVKGGRINHQTAIKYKDKISKTGRRHTTEQLNQETKSGFFKKFSKINKSIERLVEKKQERKCKTNQ